MFRPTYTRSTVGGKRWWESRVSRRCGATFLRWHAGLWLSGHRFIRPSCGTPRNALAGSSHPARSPHWTETSAPFRTTSLGSRKYRASDRKNRVRPRRSACRAHAGNRMTNTGDEVAVNNLLHGCEDRSEHRVPASRRSQAAFGHAAAASRRAFTLFAIALRRPCTSSSVPDRSRATTSRRRRDPLTVKIAGSASPLA